MQIQQKQLEKAAPQNLAANRRSQIQSAALVKRARIGSRLLAGLDISRWLACFGLVLLVLICYSGCLARNNRRKSGNLPACCSLSLSHSAPVVCSGRLTCSIRQRAPPVGSNRRLHMCV